LVEIGAILTFVVVIKIEVKAEANEPKNVTTKKSISTLFS